MAKRLLKVCVRSAPNVIVHLTFDDWFDFADWLKQEVLKRNEITITEWFYFTGRR